MANKAKLVLIAGVAVMVGGNAPAPTLCAKATSVLPKLTCVESARGAALAGDPARANVLLALAEDGADRFVERFRQSPVRYVVAEGPDAPISRDDIAALRKAGFINVLPWLSSTVKRAQIESAVRRAVAAKLVGQSPEVIDAAVKQATAQMSKALSPETGKDVDSGALPHELGHEWYRVAYWPDAPRGEANPHYGGPGPDWLDETAAVLMEAPKMFDERIKQFADRYRKYRVDPAAADDGVRKMIDLANFFKEPHPANETVRAMREENAKAGTPSAPIQIMIANDKSSLGGAARFYLQSAVGAQYMIDRTGDPAVFARIGAAFGRGESIEQWLANSEPKGMLPRDLKALQADWLVWLDQRFPTEVVEPAT